VIQTIPAIGSLLAFAWLRSLSLNCGMNLNPRRAASKRRIMRGNGVFAKAGEF
jgi:hypothetical protein